MSHRNGILHAEVVFRTIGLLVFFGRAVHGQDESTVTWNPRETGELRLTWETVLIGLLMALACCGLWKLLMWFLESRRSAVNWTKVRLWWPTAMLAWGWVMLAMFNRSESWGWVFDAIGIAFAVLNFPALIVAAAILESFGTPSVWLRIAVGSLAVWGGGYLLVRLAEWRAWINVPTSLNLSGKVG